MLLTFLFSIHAFAAAQDSLPSEPDKQTVEKLFSGIQSESGKSRSLIPGSWDREIQSREIDIAEMTGEKYPGGVAYGAVCWRTLKYTFPELKAYFEKGGVAETLVRKVKTLVNITNLVSSADRRKISFMTEIDVPVVSNFKTEVDVEQRMLSDKKLAVEWKQKSGYGSLKYNQGMAIIEPQVDQSRMTVYGVHIINDANKVPWVGRATAASFAKSHYCNFIRAVDALNL